MLGTNNSKPIYLSANENSNILNQVQSHRLFGDEPDAAQDVDGHPVADRDLGIVGAALVSADLRDGHEGGADPAHPHEDGRGLVHRILRRGVGGVQEGEVGLLHLLLGRSGKSILFVKVLNEQQYQYSIFFSIHLRFHLTF